MAIKLTKTRGSGKHTIVSIDYKKELTTSQPYKPLIKIIQNKSGRNVYGKITTRHQGGRQKRYYRLIDFKRDKYDIVGTVKTIEYDPNRTSFISLISYADGEKRYIITPKDLKIGDQIISSDKADIKIGNCTILNNIPDGTFVHNIELAPNKGGQLVRSAGSSAQVLGKDELGKYVIIKLSSGEVRKFPKNAHATIGIVSNSDHNLINLGKAGRSRNMGIRPTVRGSAMNPNDHPHGGGEGRQPVGYDAPRTPWGKRHMGIKTRAKKNISNALIIRRRNAK